MHAREIGIEIERGKVIIGEGTHLIRDSHSDSAQQSGSAQCVGEDISRLIPGSNIVQGVPGKLRYARSGKVHEECCSVALKQRTGRTKVYVSIRHIKVIRKILQECDRSGVGEIQSGREEDLPILGIFKIQIWKVRDIVVRYPREIVRDSGSA